MRDLLGGTARLLFIDVEGSTRVLRRFLGHGGQKAETVGDSFVGVFTRARDAVLAGAAAKSVLDASECALGQPCPPLRSGRPLDVTDTTH